MTLAQVIRWNTGVTDLQDNVFFDKSVLVFEASDAGANVTLRAADGTLRLINTRTGREIARHSLRDVTQVMLVGSDDAADFFNLQLGSADGGIEDGVVVYGGRSSGDVVNVYGTSRGDEFVVDPAEASVNGNTVDYSGIERIRLVKLGGNDDIQIDPDVLAEVLTALFWDPRDER